MLGPTVTGEVAITVRLIRIAVIVGQFFSVRDIPEGHQPDRAGRLCDVTVRITGMVAIARRIPEDRAINIIAAVEGETAEGRLLLAYTLAGAIAGVAALTYSARLGTAKADAGMGYELLAITAVVLGGAS